MPKRFVMPFSTDPLAAMPRQPGSNPGQVLLRGSVT